MTRCFYCKFSTLRVDTTKMYTFRSRWTVRVILAFLLQIFMSISRNCLFKWKVNAYLKAPVNQLNVLLLNNAMHCTSNAFWNKIDHKLHINVSIISNVSFKVCGIYCCGLDCFLSIYNFCIILYAFNYTPWVIRIVIRIFGNIGFIL